MLNEIMLTAASFLEQNFLGASDQLVGGEYISIPVLPRTQSTVYWMSYWLTGRVVKIPLDAMSHVQREAHRPDE